MHSVRSERYQVIDPETGLTHHARPLMGTPNGLHATLCDVEVGLRWRVQAVSSLVTCLQCIAKET
jgi:hypothetical protein